MSSTYAEVLARHQVTVPDETLAELLVPVLTGAQRQGDVFIRPRKPYTAAERGKAALVPAEGVPVVRGEATGNTHILSAADGPVWWLPAPQLAGSLLLGVVEVPEGSTAYLVHTDEHGCNGIGAGTYELTGKREQAAEIRRVAD